MTTSQAADLAAELLAYIEAATPNGPEPAVKPDHRVKFSWPPHPISYSYHIHASDWSGHTSVEMHGESFDVRIAKTPFGVFGRCQALWLEAKGQTEEQMLKLLAKLAEPFFQRQLSIGKCLGIARRFTGSIRELQPIDLLKLLYCPDRDVASEAQTELDTHASSHLFTPALIAILRDDRHPQRRSAQWCVLDLFEDLPAFAKTTQEESEALEAMRALIWNAIDDYARTAFKAGVVLGGHLPHMRGGKMLFSCLAAPSKYGRRSAIHGLFHTVEWVPDLRDEVVAALQNSAATDPDPELREFAAGLVHDIEQGSYDHIPEPVFAEEVA